VRRWSSAELAETWAIGRELAEELLPDGTLLLEGDLGAGKTALVQGIAAALGIEPHDVQSPTFTLLREHRGNRGRLLHFDLYRLAPDEIAATGFEELLLGPGVKAVEWAERLPFALPGARRMVIVRQPDERRQLEMADE